jgi:Fe-S cluster biogenesis protein NfuA
MTNDLQSVVISGTSDGKWEARHVPSGRLVIGDTVDGAQELMRDALGLTSSGRFDEPLTSDRFSGLTQAIALFLEGPVSDALAAHSGFARLDAFENGVAHIRLGGGCQGCPSSQITLFSGVRTQLQSRFGEDAIVDVAPSLD